MKWLRYTLLELFQITLGIMQNLTATQINTKLFQRDKFVFILINYRYCS